MAAQTVRRRGPAPAPPCPPDALSESLVDAMAELAALALARKKHDHAMRAMEHRLAALLRDAWNHHGQAPRVAA
ncbi:hypothetical protein [Microcystis phage Mae-JY09]